MAALSAMLCLVMGIANIVLYVQFDNWLNLASGIFCISVGVMIGARQ